MRGQALLDPKKMTDALDTGYSRMEWVRKSFGEMTREYVGRWYGPENDGVKRPINLLAQYIHTVVPNLLNQRPTVIGRSRITDLQGEATLLGLALETLWSDMMLVDVVQGFIVDAMLSPFAIAKVGLRAGDDEIKIGERGITLGQPYIARVSPDDYAADPSARSIEELGWQAHRYRVPRQYALDSGIYDPDAIARMDSIGKGRDGMDKRSGAEDISGKTDNKRFGETDTIELWDVAIRDEDRWLIGTVCGKTTGGGEPVWVNGDGQPLEYDGGSEGPYELLNFYRVPDNFAALSPGMTWMDLHRATDAVYRKMIQQALNTKRNFAYNRTAARDAITLADAPDGKGVAVDNVDTLKPIDIGGVVADFYPMIDSMMSMWNNAAGNMQLLSGAGIQSDKATGQQILQANASTRLGFMKDRVWRFASKLTNRLGFYLLTDPLIRLPVPYRLDGGHVIDIEYDAATRRGDYNQMTFEIEVASMVGRDPEIALKRKIEALNVLLQFAPAAGVFNLQKLARQLGREIGWLDIDEIVNDMEMQALYMSAGLGQPQKAGVAGMAGPGARQQPGAGPGAGVGNAPNARAGMVRGAYGVGAEMQEVA